MGIYRLCYSKGFRYLVFKDDTEADRLLDLSNSGNKQNMHINATLVECDESRNKLMESDFLRFSPRLLTMTDSTLSKFGDSLHDYGNFVRIVAEDAPYFGFFCTERVAALDTEKSDILWSKDRMTPVVIKKYTLRKDKLNSSHLFRLQSAPYLSLFCTEWLKDIVLDSNLIGLEFKDVNLS